MLPYALLSSANSAVALGESLTSGCTFRAAARYAALISACVACCSTPSSLHCTSCFCAGHGSAQRIVQGPFRCDSQMILQLLACTCRSAILPVDDSSAACRDLSSIIASVSEP